MFCVFILLRPGKIMLRLFFNMNLRDDDFWRCEFTIWVYYVSREAFYFLILSSRILFAFLFIVCLSDGYAVTTSIAATHKHSLRTKSLSFVHFLPLNPTLYAQSATGNELIPSVGLAARIDRRGDFSTSLLQNVGTMTQLSYFYDFVNCYGVALRRKSAAVKIVSTLTTIQYTSMQTLSSLNKCKV